MTWSDKEKELFAVGTSVAAGCKPCTDYHFKKALETGATNEEIQFAMNIAVSVRQSATENMQAFALSHLNPDLEVPDHEDVSRRTRIGALAAIGAAFAVNSTFDLGAYLDIGKAAGIDDNELRTALKLAAFIKKMGASHVEKMAPPGSFDTSSSAE